MVSITTYGNLQNIESFDFMECASELFKLLQLRKVLLEQYLETRRYNNSRKEGGIDVLPYYENIDEVNKKINKLLCTNPL